MSVLRNVLGGMGLLAALMLAAAPVHAQDLGSASPITVASNQPEPAAPTRPGLSESVAAVVNDELISTYDVRQRMRLLVATSGVQPTSDNLSQIEREAMRALIDEHLEMQEIRDIETKQKELKLEPTDAEIEATIGDMARQAGVKPEQLRATLHADDVDPATLRDQIRARLSWERYITARYRDSVAIGPHQVEAALERANAAAEKPQYQLSEIFIDASRVGGRQAALDGANQLIGQMQQGAPFGAVAHQFSALPTAANGGDAGWLSAAELPPEVGAAVEQMRPGQLSAAIPTANGVYVVALRDKRAGSAAMVVNLKQAAISLPADAGASRVAAAQAELERLRRRITDCDALESEAAHAPGVIAGDLGETDVKELRPAFQAAIAGLKVGQVSAPVRTDAGLHLIAVCDRHVGGAHAITRADIEDRMKGEQFDMLARRYIRDLRNSATIETR